ncbi:tRNA (N6-isopentenyl adenosine(37)-C2)-methylthiotransferase MiaB, partial [Mesorhizobium sp. M00.F.Ca.ET.186.01.1.1]
MTESKVATPDLKSAKSPKTTADFAKYFQPPSLKDAKKRGKEEIQVLYDFAIPEDMQGIGKG